MINLRQLLSEHEMQSLANFNQGDFWTLLKKVVGAELDAIEDEIRMSPKFSDEDLTEDLRFKMGGVVCLKRVLELPDEARKLLK